MYSLESPRWVHIDKAILMSTHNILFHDKYEKKKKSKNIPKYLFSLAVGRISYWLKNEFEFATVNESSVFESFRFYCMYTQQNN